MPKRWIWDSNPRSLHPSTTKGHNFKIENAVVLMYSHISVTSCSMNYTCVILGQAVYGEGRVVTNGMIVLVPCSSHVHTQIWNPSWGPRVFNRLVTNGWSATDFEPACVPGWGHARLLLFETRPTRDKLSTWPSRARHVTFPCSSWADQMFNRF